MTKAGRRRTSVIERLLSSVRTPLFRNSLYLLTKSTMSYALGFLFWLAVARAYSPSTMGIGVAMYNTLVFLAGAATLGLPIGIIRFLPTEEDRVGLINTALTVSGLMSIILGLVFLVGIDLWAPALSLMRSESVFAAAYVFSLSCYTLTLVLDHAYVAARRADYALIRLMIYNTLKVPIPLVVAPLLGVFGIVFSWTLALLASVLVGVFFLLPRLLHHYLPIPTFRRRGSPGLVHYSLWNHASIMAAVAASSLLPLIILNAAGQEGGAEATAYFYAAFSIAGVLYVVPGSFSTSLFVEGSHPDTSYVRDVRRTLRLSMAIMALFVLLAMLLGRLVLALFGEVYARESYDTMLLLVLASPLVLATNMFTTDLRLAKRVRPLVAITLISAATTLGAAYLLVPSLGILGAGLGFTLGQGVALLSFALERWANVHRSSADGKRP